MSTILLLSPPLALLIMLVFIWLKYHGLAVLSAGEKWPAAAGKGKAYACGEDVKNHRIPPDYSQFFPFAFFFTIMHVVALMVATVPAAQSHAALFAGGYLACAAIGLFVLFRR